MPESRERKTQGGGFGTSFGGFKHFTNPYPWMSAVEAKVKLDLERRGVPFSWRWFDGDALNFRYLLPAFQPEFTLKEYHLVILVFGNFFGSLPGVLDTNALAQVLLEYDGWKVVSLYEVDIDAKGVAPLLDAAAPELVRPAFTGKERPNPYGNVDLLAKRKLNLRGQGLLRKKFDFEQQRPGDALYHRRKRRTFGNRIRSRRRRNRPGTEESRRGIGRVLGHG